MPSAATERSLAFFVFIFSRAETVFFCSVARLKTAACSRGYVSCKVTKGVFFGVFPGNISTGVKQEVSSVSSHGPESGASAQ